MGKKVHITPEGAEVVELTGEDAQWDKTNDELERESGALDE